MRKVIACYDVFMNIEICFEVFSGSFFTYNHSGIDHLKAARVIVTHITVTS